MKPSRASIFFDQLWLNYGLTIKVAVGFVIIVAVIEAIYAAGWKPDKTFGHGPGWECARDEARTNDPLCWKITPPKK